MELKEYDLKNKKELEFYQNLLESICSIANVEDVNVKKGASLHSSFINSTHDDNFETTSLTIKVEPWDSYNYRYFQNLTLSANGDVCYNERLEHVYFVRTGEDDCDKDFEDIYCDSKTGKIDDLKEVQKIFDNVLGLDIKEKRAEQKRQYDEIVAENKAIADAYKINKSNGMRLDYERSFRYYLKNGVSEHDASQLASKKIIKEELLRFERSTKKRVEAFAKIKDGNVTIYAYTQENAVNEEGATCLRTIFDKLVTLPARDIGVSVEDGDYKLINLNASKIMPEGIFEKTPIEVGKNTDMFICESMDIEIDECEFHNDKFWALCTLDNVDIANLTNNQDLLDALEEDDFDIDNLRLEIIAIKDQPPQLSIVYYGSDYEHNVDNEYEECIIIYDGDQFPLCITSKDVELMADSIMNKEEALDAIRESELDDRDVR